MPSGIPSGSRHSAVCRTPHRSPPTATRDSRDSVIPWTRCHRQADVHPVCPPDAPLVLRTVGRDDHNENEAEEQRMPVQRGAPRRHLHQRQSSACANGQPQQNPRLFDSALRCPAEPPPSVPLASCVLPGNTEFVSLCKVYRRSSWSEAPVRCFPERKMSEGRKGSESAEQGRAAPPPPPAGGARRAGRGDGPHPPCSLSRRPAGPADDARCTRDGGAVVRPWGG
jgi:hypothetical protein